MKTNTINPINQNKCIFTRALLNFRMNQRDNKLKNKKTQDQTDKKDLNHKKNQNKKMIQKHQMIEYKNGELCLIQLINKKNQIKIYQKLELVKIYLMVSESQLGLIQQEYYYIIIIIIIPQAKTYSIIYLKCGKYGEFLKNQEFIDLIIHISINGKQQITFDIQRTFSDNVNFQDQTILSVSLVNVLKALSVALPDMGYCQGLNFLTAASKMVTNDENAFWNYFDQ